MENMTTQTTILFMDQSGKIIRTKDLPYNPCIVYGSTGALRVYSDYSDPSKDVLSLAGVKKIHVSGPGLGTITEAREIAPGSYILYSVFSRYLWIREEEITEISPGPAYYIRADDDLPAGARIKIEVE